MTENQVRIFSFGGGVQSTAVLVLQALGELPEPYDYFIFANVGEDSENPRTLEYIEQHSKPFAEKHGVPFVEVRHHRETLWQHIHRTKRSVPIPARMSNGAPGHRTCTTDFKIRVVDKWVKKGKYTHAVTGLGISLDEAHRWRDEEWHDHQGKSKIGYWKKREYPLLDLRLNRQDCKQITQDAALPPAPKSSCYFCPFMRRGEWIELKRKDPELFAKAVEIDQHINEKRAAMGRDRVYLHVDLNPLENAVGDQLPLFSDDELDNCESGYCMT